MKNIFLMIFTITSAPVIVAMQPYRQSAHERLLSLTIQRTEEPTQTPVTYNTSEQNHLPQHQMPQQVAERPFLTQPRNTERNELERRNLPAAMTRNMGYFQLPTTHNGQEQSDDPSSLGSYSLSDDSFLSVSSYNSQTTENRENHASSHYHFRGINNFRPTPNDDEAQVARFLIQIRGIPTRLTGAQDQRNR